MNEYYEARQHLNLSHLAYETIESDKFMFQEKPSMSKILNRIFTMYRDYADASIANACARYKEDLESRVKSISDGAVKTELISALTQSYKTELIEKANSYPRGHQFKFQLNRQNYEYIMDWHDTEEAYDKSAGRFIKAILEEYARKPLVEREAILFRDMIEMINACVESHLALAITLYSGARFEVRPYGVLIDQGNNYHYLVGYSRKAGEKGEDKPSSFRLSNIREYKLFYGRSGRITEAQKKSLKQRIDAVGVQFLLQEPDAIRVRLTKRGKSMYESQAHLRPAFTSQEVLPNGDWIYDFNCSQAQAQFYFFKFGADAEVVKPFDLRELFANKYVSAQQLYSKY